MQRITPYLLMVSIARSNAAWLFARAFFCNPSGALFPLAMASTYRLPNHRL
jgi:hypothetical protein